MFSKIEQIVLFPIVRVVAFVSAVVLLLAMVGGLIFALTFNARQTANIISQVQKIVNPEETKEKIMAQTRLPENIERYLVEDTQRQTLERWLVNFETDREKKVFLTNLSKVIAEAEKNDPGKVYDYINTFWSVTRKQFADDEDSPFGINLGRIVERVVRTTTIFGVLFLFAIFTFAVLVLLLLSIERGGR